MRTIIGIAILLWLEDYQKPHYHPNNPWPESVIVFNLLGWMMIIETLL